MRAGDAREADVIVHQELPGAVAVVSPRTMHIAVVVAIRGVAADVEDRPVGNIPEQKIGILLQLLRLVQRSDLDEALLVALSGDVSQLARIAAPEGGLAPAV